MITTLPGETLLIEGPMPESIDPARMAFDGLVNEIEAAYAELDPLTTEKLATRATYKGSSTGDQGNLVQYVSTE